MKTLDIEAVRAFVLTADMKSFTRAAEVMDTTQSTISLKIRRLESMLGRRLLDRTPRLVRLSADGGAFLPAARTLVAAHQGAFNAFSDAQPRRLVVGVSHHVVGAELPRMLQGLNRADPTLILEMRIASSRDVLDEFDAGRLDAGVVLRHDSRRLDGELLLEEGFGWMGAPDFEWTPGQPLRLATQAEPCSVRAMALDALAQAAVPWMEVFVGGGVSTIGAAVSAGLAVAALGRRVAPAGTMDLGPRLGLPPLPTRDVVLHTGPTDAQARGALRALGAAIRATAVGG
ncbi:MULTISPECIES: LysR family transcriptional regulator [unclassified Achromobacter]|uniref:LysR family transcriptional regulator n=1 Tax=unclassified Achromobacter TaxID=2626865 RepID=UPI000B51724E|nr:MULTISPECIES: LysR family transcriptional regulator [unclassified Achromobacter]OWT80187.1 LysR family transcriptional regulator [Achromobacter sp. HZ34]OWT82070.1 LysR family transcriptional regulator [Achromobacter sp. HZ28]